jgi:hypothetical protein
LIFDGGVEGEAIDDAIAHHRRASEILSACAVEANRHAIALARIDAAVGGALASGNTAIDPQILQSLDILRQEADGLAQVLNVATSLQSPDAIIEYDVILRCLPMAAQRARITS